VAFQQYCLAGEAQCKFALKDLYRRPIARRYVYLGAIPKYIVLWFWSILTVWLKEAISWHQYTSAIPKFSPRFLIMKLPLRLAPKPMRSMAFAKSIINML